MSATANGIVRRCANSEMGDNLKAWHSEGLQVDGEGRGFGLLERMGQPHALVDIASMLYANMQSERRT